jgi:FkbM family methyltransferase
MHPQMYHYPDIVDHMRKLYPKDSAELLNKIFLSLITDYLPCDWFIEAGAFEGNASKFIKSKNKNCQVYAFEANIDNYNHFKHDLTEINYLYMAISNRSGKIVFKQQSHTSDGFTFPKVRGNNSTRTRVLDKKTVYNDIEVPCVTLDDFFKDKISAEDSIGIWLDLEGTAFEALTTARDVLKQTTILKIEVEDKQYWEDQKLSTDVIEFLSSVDLIPLFCDFEGMTVAQYNILFTHRRICDENLKIFIDQIIHGK